MYKNQLQELAQRSCFNLPSYSSIREGPDHAPRFKAIVNFNGDLFESPNHCSTLRQAEHAAAHVALNSLSSHGPSPSLAARILDETGVYKNLLQEIAQRVGAPLPQYTTFRSGSGHQPVFKGIVELSGIVFHGEPAKNKKQAEKNAAMAAWSSLKQLAQQDATSSTESESSDEQEQIRISRCLLNYYLKQKTEATNSSSGAPVPFQKQFPVHRPSSPQPPVVTTSKILPLICQNTNPQTLPSSSLMANDRPLTQPQFQVPKVNLNRVQKFPAVGAPPYVPHGHYRMPYHVIAPPVIMRTAVPVFSAPPFPQPSVHPLRMMQPRPVRVAQPILIRQAVPAFNASPVKNKNPPQTVITSGRANEAVCQAETASDFGNNQPKPDQVTKSLEQLKI